MSDSGWKNTIISYKSKLLDIPQLKLWTNTNQNSSTVYRYGDFIRILFDNSK